MKSKKVLGIDLGTTYCCVSVIDESGAAVILKNSSGVKTTPSWVLFGENNKVTVGEEAKNSASAFPNSIVSEVKRQMGNESYRYSTKSGEYRAEEISALILRKLVADACAELGEDISDVVITCPAYFFVNERKATQIAGELAGLNVLQLLNEPTAAAIAYGMDQIHPDQKKNVLVYDLGGGTFDVTLISIIGANRSKDGKSNIVVVCTGGKATLGGVDWDQALVDIMLQKLSLEHSFSIDDDVDDPIERSTLYQDLAIKAENIKKKISAAEQCREVFYANGSKMFVQVTRKEFEEYTKNLITNTITETQKMLDEAKKKGEDHIDEILLVGGSSRMPQVAKAVESAFHIKPFLFDPDESVAKGAAIMGLKLQLEDIGIKLPSGRDTRNDTITLPGSEEEIKLPPGMGAVITNVSSKSFGSSALDSAALAQGEKMLKIYNIIYKNDSIPVSAQKTFLTVEDGQNGMTITIYENDNARVVDENKGFDLESSNLLWKGLLSFPRPMPAHHPCIFQFSLDANGLLNVRFYDEKTKSEHTQEISVGYAISKDESNAMLERQSALNISE